jgi:hypothetical protein
VAAVAAACLVVIALYSSFGTNWRGPTDSITAYATYFHRGGGGGDHAHAWNYYFQILAAYLPLRGLAWTRWPMVGLAVVCWLAALVAAFRSRHTPCAELSSTPTAARCPVPPTIGFVQFLIFYTLILTALYCTISYKTPWCLLSFLHGLILLVAVGAWAILRGPGERASCPQNGNAPSASTGKNAAGTAALRIACRCLACAVLLLAAARLGWECFLLNTKHSVSDRNSLVYNHTSPNVLNLAATMECLAQVSSEGHEMEIQVVAPEFWPLPWYLRRFHWDRRCQDCWWENPAKWAEDAARNRRPAVILFAPESRSKIEPRLEGRYQGRMSYNLRPRMVLELCVRGDLWDAYERQ